MDPFLNNIMMPTVNEPTDGDTVSALTTCATSRAAYLYIENFSQSLQKFDHYDIGGTYIQGIDSQPDLWFYFTTAKSLTGSCLMNLFVNIRGPSHLKISVSKRVEFESLVKLRIDPHELCLILELESFTFNTVLPDDNVYIKTFCFTPDYYETYEHSSLYIPIKIEKFNDTVLDQNVLRGIQDEHSYDSLYKNRSDGDFTLKSNTGKSYKIHKIFLTHFEELAKSMSDSQNDILELDIDDEQTEILIKFLYTATVDIAQSRDYTSTLDLARRFNMHSLFTLVQYIMSSRINMTNMVDTLIIADCFNLQALKADVVEYMVTNQDAIEAESLRRLRVSLREELSGIMSGFRPGVTLGCFASGNFLRLA